MFQPDECALVVIDIQGKLAELMWDKDRLYRNAGILARAMRMLDVPVLWCQQNPKALGDTVGPVREHLEGLEPIDKIHFSCWGDEGFRQRFEETGRKKAILCGIEAHVCVYQTAMDLLGQGCEVHVAADAISSRREHNYRIAIQRMCSEGVKLCSTEMVLFELLGDAKHPHFKDISKMIR